MELSLEKSFQKWTHKELLEQLSRMADRVPRILIEHAATRGEAFETRLIGIVKKSRYWQLCPWQPGFWLPFHAMMILGRYATERAGFAILDGLRTGARVDGHQLYELVHCWRALLQNKPESVAKAVVALLDSRGDLPWVREISAEIQLYEALEQGPGALEAFLERIAAIASNGDEVPEVRRGMAEILLDFPRDEYRSLVESYADVFFPGVLGYTEEQVEDRFERKVDGEDLQPSFDPYDFYSKKVHWVEDASGAQAASERHSVF